MCNLVDIYIYTLHSQQSTQKKAAESRFQLYVMFLYKTPLFGLASSTQSPVRRILPPLYLTKERQLGISDDDYAIVFQNNHVYQEIFVVVVNETRVHHIEYASCLHSKHNRLQLESSREILRRMLELLLENSTPDMVFSIELKSDIDVKVKMVFDSFKFEALHSSDTSTTYRLGLF